MSLLDNRRQILLKRLEIENRVLTYLLMINDASINLKETLLNMGIKSVCVYGMNNAGQLLLKCFEKNKIECFGVDRKAKSLNNIEGKIYSDIDVCPMAEIYIVAGELYFDEIKEIIQNRCNTCVVKASEFLEELLSVPIQYH